MNRLASYIALVATAALALPSAVSAQTVDQWTAIQQLQVDLKADRQAVEAANLRSPRARRAPFGPFTRSIAARSRSSGNVWPS